MLSYDVISTYDGSSTCERKKLDRKNEKSLLCRVLYQILVYNRLSARMVIPCQSLSFFFFFSSLVLARASATALHFLFDSIYISLRYTSTKYQVLLSPAMLTRKGGREREVYTRHGSGRGGGRRGRESTVVAVVSSAPLIPRLACTPRPDRPRLPNIPLLLQLAAAFGRCGGCLCTKGPIAFVALGVLGVSWRVFPVCFVLLPLYNVFSRGGLSIF